MTVTPSPSRPQIQTAASPTSRSFTEFTAYELPAKKWMNWICPKARLRVRGETREFVSPVVKVDNQGPVNPETPSETRTHWAWENDGRPSFADANEQFDIIIERRLLFGYKRFRRTKPANVRQACPNDRGPCTLTLYDGQYPSTDLEGKMVIGRISFTLS